MGPTASGKSRLALELASHCPVEIVSVDSAQVYRQMDIGTAKPTTAERNAVIHHLLDIRQPTETYSAAQFRDDAMRLIGEIRNRGRIPLFVGGTMLYFKALTTGLSKLPGANPSIREQIDVQAKVRGWPAMHSILAKVDPISATRINSNDSQRIQRALEVYYLTGTSLSKLTSEPDCSGNAIPALKIALVPSIRAELHARIALRADNMLREGLVEELRSLREQYTLSHDLPSMRCVGYRQAWQYLDGELSTQELRDHTIFATRQLAKRQLTWIRATHELHIFDAFGPDLDVKIAPLVNEALER